MSPARRLRAAGLLCGLALFACSEPEPTIERTWENLLLISVDTLRPDYTSPYGHNIPTPALLRLANEGVLFEQASSPAPMTQPAHSSLFTGNYPGRHGVRDNVSYTLSENALTLAERLRDGGFQTAAVVGAKVISRLTGLDQGFDHYDDEFSTEQLTEDPLLVERPGAEVRERALRWLDARDPSRPFALFVHFYDPHVPNEPPGKLAKRYADRPYDGEIVYTDRCIGAILGHLQEKGLLSSTAVVLVSDHGESLGEHGEATHGLFVYEAAIRIPLIIWLPGEEVERGVRVTSPVSLVDVAPTVLELFELPPHDMDGVSLVPFLNRKGIPDRDIYSETQYPLFYRWSPSYSVRKGRYKYIHTTDPELYDVVNDRAEQHNLIEHRAKLVDSMRTAISIQQRRWAEAATTAEEARALSSLEAMARIGYTGGAAADESLSGPLPDMKSRVELYEELSGAMTLMGQQRWEDARASFESLLEKDPGNPSALLNLGQVLARMGQLDEAELRLRASLESIPENRQAQATLGMVLFAGKRLDEAQAVFNAILAGSPKSPEPMFYMGQIHELRGEFAQALERYEAVQELLPGMPGLPERLAAVRVALGRQ